MAIEQAVILCGGKGERLGNLVRDVPKPMVRVGGSPLLDQIIVRLGDAGIRRFTLVAGYLGDVIRRHYRNRKDIEVLIEPEPMGTAGALRWCARQRVRVVDPDFLVAYGDVFIDFDVRRLIEAHDCKRLGTLLVRASDHPWDSDLVVADDDGRVLEFVTRREPGRLYRNVANAAMYALTHWVFDHIPEEGPADLDGDVFPVALALGEEMRVHFLEEGGFVKDMGTPERLAEVEQYIAEEALAVVAHSRPKPLETVFLDRDGVLTVDGTGVVDRPEKLKLLPGAAEALATFRRLGLRCVVVTNQPIVAKGLCTPEMLGVVHGRLRAMAAASGGKIERVYSCPHHPETHHGEGVLALRRACRCRKPAPGMIFQARRELGLDLAACAMVGDRECDVRAGKAAGIRTVLVGDRLARPPERGCAPDFEFSDLLAFARHLVESGSSLL